MSEPESRSGARKVRVVINQQQAEVIDRLVLKGVYGRTRGEVIRAGFAEFCRTNPELLAPRGPGPSDDSDPKASAE